MKYCQNCGSELKENVTFCSNCGNRVSGNETPKYSGPHPVVENRGVALWVILTLVTCGICGIIWYINLVNDVNKVCDDDKSTQSGGMVFLLTIITCGIYGIIWLYQAGKRMEVAGRKYNIEISDNSTVYLLLSLFKFDLVSYALIQSDLNKFSNE